MLIVASILAWSVPDCPTSVTNTSYRLVFIASWPANTISAAAARFGRSIIARQIREVDFPSPFLSPFSPFYFPAMTRPLYPPGVSQPSRLIHQSPGENLPSSRGPITDNTNLAADWLAGRISIQSIRLFPPPFVANEVKDSHSRQAAHAAGDSTSHPPTCHSTDKAPLSILVTR